MRRTLATLMVTLVTATACSQPSSSPNEPDIEDVDTSTSTPDTSATPESSDDDEVVGPGQTAAALDVPDIPDGVTSADGYLAHLDAEGFSGVLSVVRGGEVSAERALGLARRETETPNTLNTAFDIGSIAKTFTAATVLTLVDDGTLALNDPLGEILPDVPDDKRDITVEQLLDHTAGLGVHHDTDGDFEPMTRDEALARILEHELTFAPGKGTSYSNSGYTLLAILVEEVTGRGFAEVLGEVVVEAGLTHTGLYGSDALQGIDVATGYEGLTHGDNNPARWELTWALLGNGGMASTVDDLHAWWGQLLTAGLLTAESVAVLADGDGMLGAATLGETTYRFASGMSDFGFGALVAGTPDGDTQLVVATNAVDPDSGIVAEAALVLVQLAAEAG